MTDFLEEKKREIKSRMDELKVLVDEYHRLESAYAALDGVDDAGSGVSDSSRRSSKRSSSSSSSGGGTGRRGRPKGSGSRAKEALQLVKDRPGITIPEIAEAMEMKQNYLYRVMPDLQKEGLVKKEGRGWHALAAA